MRLRGKGKARTDYGMHDIYKFYKKRYENKSEITASTYTSVIKAFCTAVLKEVIFHNMEFAMPARLGYLRIKKRKVKLVLDKDGKIDKRQLRPDWGATNKLWALDEKAKEEKKIVYHMNEHSNGYNLSWLWDRLTCNVRNQFAYSLDIARWADRELATAAKSTNVEIDYYC